MVRIILHVRPPGDTESVEQSGNSLDHGAGQVQRPTDGVEDGSDGGLANVIADAGQERVFQLGSGEGLTEEELAQVEFEDVPPQLNPELNSILQWHLSRERSPDLLEPMEPRLADLSYTVQGVSQIIPLTMPASPQWNPPFSKFADDTAHQANLRAVGTLYHHLAHDKIWQEYNFGEAMRRVQGRKRIQPTVHGTTSINKLSSAHVKRPLHGQAMATTHADVSSAAAQEHGEAVSLQPIGSTEHPLRSHVHMREQA